MSADNVALLVGTGAAVLASIVALAAAIVLTRRVRDVRQLADELRYEMVPLLRDARVVVDQAATEMVRVGDVLGSAEAVSATVDSASRLAYRAFSNPVVKLVAYGSGVGGALRRLFGGTGRRHVDIEAAPRLHTGRRGRSRSEHASRPRARSGR
ncbi:MAG: hypothetical protein ACYDD6_07755 [Acidimicrobiales bacterium]